MKQLRLTRVGEHQDAMFGVLAIDGRPVCVTLEDKWRNNERMISCIPKGKYVIKRHKSPKFGECFKVENVPNRSEILIHAGNTDADTHGCILLGTMFGMVGEKAGILSSRSAMSSFNLLMLNEIEAELEIV
jgi:hypothetical protein